MTLDSDRRDVVRPRGEPKKISESVLIAEVERRLMSKYAHEPSERVSSAVNNAHARFELSRIRDFIPLLVERHARAELSKLTEPAAGSPQEFLGQG